MARQQAGIHVAIPLAPIRAGLEIDTAVNIWPAHKTPALSLKVISRWHERAMLLCASTAESPICGHKRPRAYISAA
jgi:hypothetical protein